MQTQKNESYLIQNSATVITMNTCGDVITAHITLNS